MQQQQQHKHVGMTTTMNNGASSSAVNGSHSGRGYNNQNNSNNNNNTTTQQQQLQQQQQQRENREQQQMNMAALEQGGVHAKTINARDRPRYKTRLCNSFRQEGTCRFGSACLFAHSSEELRRTLTDGGADGSRDVSWLGGGGG